MKIKWKKVDLADPANDLCARVNGVYADIMSDYMGRWTCLWNNSLTFGPFPSRQSAIEWFDSAVDDLKKSRSPKKD